MPADADVTRHYCFHAAYWWRLFITCYIRSYDYYYWAISAIIDAKIAAIIIFCHYCCHYATPAYCYITLYAMLMLSIYFHWLLIEFRQMAIWCFLRYYYYATCCFRHYFIACWCWLLMLSHDATPLLPLYYVAILPLATYMLPMPLFCRHITPLIIIISLFSPLMPMPFHFWYCLPLMPAIIVIDAITDCRWAIFFCCCALLMPLAIALRDIIFMLMPLSLMLSLIFSLITMLSLRFLLDSFRCFDAIIALMMPLIAAMILLLIFTPLLLRCCYAIDEAISLPCWLFIISFITPLLYYLSMLSHYAILRAAAIMLPLLLLRPPLRDYALRWYAICRCCLILSRHTLLMLIAIACWCQHAMLIAATISHICCRAGHCYFISHCAFSVYKVTPYYTVFADYCRRQLATLYMPTFTAIIAATFSLS